LRLLRLGFFSLRTTHNLHCSSSYESLHTEESSLRYWYREDHQNQMLSSAEGQEVFDLIGKRYSIGTTTSWLRLSSYALYIYVVIEFVVLRAFRSLGSSLFFVQHCTLPSHRASTSQTPLCSLRYVVAESLASRETTNPPYHRENDIYRHISSAAARPSIHFRPQSFRHTARR
jgi:hypothetical protein